MAVSYKLDEDRIIIIIFFTVPFPEGVLDGRDILLRGKAQPVHSFSCLII